MPNMPFLLLYRVLLLVDPDMLVEALIQWHASRGVSVTKWLLSCPN